ncbi:MAG TPA: AI-2E family transporter [Thermotogales bacterium]|nr:AI-2E family transporter [Thermotogales bacterium]
MRWKSHYFLPIYFFSYLVLLKILPVTVGSLTIGFFFVLIIDALAKIIQKIIKLPVLSKLLASIFFLGFMALSIYNIIPVVLNEGKSVFDFVIKFSEKPLSEHFPGISEKNLEFLENLFDNIGIWFGKFSENILSHLVSILPNLITSTILLVLASSYITFVLPKLPRFIPLVFPGDELERTKSFLKRVYRDLRLFVSGQITVALFVGIMVWFGMSLSGIKHPLFLGFLAGITDFIPFLGVILSAIPALMIGISQQGMIGIIKVVIVLTVANQIESWFLVPKILSNRLNLNWFLILVTIIGFGELYGFIGVLIAVPTMIMVKNFWGEYILGKVKIEVGK